MVTFLTSALLAALLPTSAVLAQTNPGAQTNQTSPPRYPSPWASGLGDWADAHARAVAFVSQLTLTEKVNLTTGVGWEGEKCVGNNGAIPRLGFKALCMQDSPLGVRFADFSSAYPAGVTIAATWDRELFRRRGHDMGTEHKLKGVDVQLGPVVGPIGRSPEGGRNWEGFSPDPVLSGVAVAETVKGIQGAGVIACTKHFIGNEQEHFRQGPPPGYLKAAISSNIDDVTMHELYLWPFADAVRAGTGSIMCSYNQVNNSYACQNSYMQNDLLKNELGFQGFIMSDWQAQHSGVSSALAGLDMTMPGDVTFDSKTSYWGANLTVAVLNGTVPQWRLDDMAVRIVAAWYYVDRESNQVPDSPNFSSWTTDTYGFRHAYAQERYELVNHHVDVFSDHIADIREFAAKGTVLLKNTGNALPLTGNEKLTAVFGSDAGENQYGPNGCSDRGCDNGTLAMGWGSGTSNFPYLVTPLEAIKAEALQNRRSVESVLDDYAYSQATTLASRASQVDGVCLVFANSDSGEGYIIVDGNEGDRNNLTLWHDGDALIKKVAGACNNTVVVLHTVGPVLLTEWYDHPNVTAILWAGLPGQESGNSLTDVLYGRVNPGAKSPFTWGATRESYGTDLIYTPNNGVEAPQDNFVEGVFIDYRAFDKSNTSPIYEFGYGLSYTTFSYSNLQIAAHPVPAYTSSSARTAPAPSYGTIDNSSSAYLFPTDFPGKINAYIYPFLNSTDLAASSGDPQYGTPYSWPEGSYDSSAQPILAAGSTVAPGGNERLYDVLFTVTATVTNTGSQYSGDEVAQLYVSLGGPNDPKVVLRGFDKLKNIAPGASATFTAEITRRDVSNWDTVSQNWVISSYPKTVYVGSSSRTLPLSGSLVFGATVDGGSGSSPSTYANGGSGSHPTSYANGGSGSSPSSYNGGSHPSSLQSSASAVHPTEYTTPSAPAGYTTHPGGSPSPSTLKTASSAASSVSTETKPSPYHPGKTSSAAATTTSCPPEGPDGYAPPPPPPVYGHPGRPSNNPSIPPVPLPSPIDVEFPETSNNPTIPPVPLPSPQGYA
jgi:beta-glucosidase